MTKNLQNAQKSWNQKTAIKTPQVKPLASVSDLTTVIVPGCCS